MALFRRNNKEQETREMTFDSLLFNGLTGWRANTSMKLSAVYRCVDVISDSVAQLPLLTYKVDGEGYKELFKAHPAFNLLNEEPNPMQTRFTLIKGLVVSALLEGNGYAIIDRDSDGNAAKITFVEPQKVSLIQRGGNILYNVVGRAGAVEDCNMIHLLNFTYDGINGVSTIAHAANTLTTATDAENNAQGFFRGGSNVGGILKVQGSLNTKQKQDLKNAWTQTFSPTVGNPQGVAILEGNMDYQPISISPADSQLLESRAFDVISICRFFGVSPVKCFDLTHSSYSTVEATQLAFLTDTLQPLLEKIELEIKRKVFKRSEREYIDVKFNTSSLLRADKNSLANYYKNLFEIGAITPNEIRRELDLPKVEGGDVTFLQLNMAPVAKITDINEKNNA